MSLPEELQNLVALANSQAQILPLKTMRNKKLAVDSAATVHSQATYMHKKPFQARSKSLISGAAFSMDKSGDHAFVKSSNVASRPNLVTDEEGEP